MRQKYFFKGSIAHATEMLKWGRDNNAPMISVVRFTPDPEYWGTHRMIKLYSKPDCGNFTITLWMRCRASDYAMLRLRFPDNIVTDY